MVRDLRLRCQPSNERELSCLSTLVCTPRDPRICFTQGDDLAAATVWMHHQSLTPNHPYPEERIP